MKRFVSRHISRLVLIGFLAVFVYYFATNVQQFKILLDINAAYIAVVAISHLGIIYSNGLFIKFILRPFDKVISAKEGYKVSLISSIGNFFLPIGSGTGFRAVYLKKKHNLSYSKFLSILYGNYIAVFLLNSGLGLLALLVLSEHQNSSAYAVLMLVFGGVFTAMLLLSSRTFYKTLSKLFKLENRTSKLFSLIQKILYGWSQLLENKKLLTQLVLLQGLNFVFQMTIVFASLGALGLTINTWAIVLYSAISSLTLLINITPGSIGIKESIYIFSATVLGLTTPQILSIAILDRGVKFIMLFFSWVVLRPKFTKQTEAN